MISKADVGNEVYLVKWDRSVSRKQRIEAVGTLTHFARVNAAIDNQSYRIVRKLDFGLVLSRGSVTDSYIEVFRTAEDMEKQRNATAQRRELIEAFSKNDFVKNLSLEKVESLLKIVHQ